MMLPEAIDSDPRSVGLAWEIDKGDLWLDDMSMKSNLAPAR